MTSTDLQLAQDGRKPVWVVVIRKEKGKAGRAARTLNIPRSAIPAELSSALDSWPFLRSAAFALQRRPPPAPGSRQSFWLLPGDRASDSSSSRCNAWLALAFSHLGVVSPPGCSFSSHSLRSGAASACTALKIPISTVAFWGGWVALDTIHTRYIDPTVPDTPEARAFFGWLAPPPSAQG